MQRWHAAGVVAAFAASVAAAVFSERFPWAAPAASLFAWGVGKMLGVPMDSVVDTALQSMRVDRKTLITIKSLESLPPEAARAVVESLPPPARNQIIAFVESMRPPERE